MKTNKKQCFTRIEWLVVIAMSGILAGIVLVSLSGVREKSEVASLKSTLSSATTIASLCYNDAGALSAVNSSTEANICSDTSIVGAWPTPDKGTISYTSGDTDITGTAPNGTSITCSIATGSCSEVVATP
ncbi:MAG: type II secretion system protein [Patescibacteria group bacterium]|jgi:type II secretory pathway pseudopilin PulG|nr:type II secretion system protein [Patescibacteria group bacterium]